MDQRPNLKNIRLLLTKGFSDEELRELCFDVPDFEPVRDKLGQASAKPEIIHRLVEFAEQKSLIEPLLDWAQEQNPARYQKYYPYYETVITHPESIRGGVSPASPGTSRLCEKIGERGRWGFLEQVAIQAVTAGGITAMGSYRRASLRLIGSAREEKNPATDADFEATGRVLETVNSLLPPIAEPSELHCTLCYLAEETRYQQWFENIKTVQGEIRAKVQPGDRFFSKRSNVLRVLVDGVDGTSSFVRGLPLFCSAVAILVDDQPRVSAIYDPIHHVVYSALLKGCYEEPENETEAYMWPITTGTRINLLTFAQEERKELRKEALGIHFTRTNPPKLDAFLRPASPSTYSTLERLVKASGVIYALNSGVFAMIYVATGAFGGFVNNVTNLWDVAAGEVLVRACGGHVTSFEGLPIDYTTNKQTSIVASKAHLHSEILDILNDRR